MELEKKKLGLAWKIGIASGSAIVFFLLVFIVAGIYFSQVIYDQGLNPQRPQRKNDVEVVSIEGTVIELKNIHKDDLDFMTPGLFGIFWDLGFGQVLDVQSSDNGKAKRGFKLLSGEKPVPGTKCSVEVFIYPREPFDIPAFPAKKVSYSSSLGSFDAYYMAAQKKNWAILVHGNGMVISDVQRYAMSFNDLGYPTLSIAFRNDKNQPRDPSGMMRYGVTEWNEVEGAVKYALSNGSGPVILFGMSMGAGIALNFMNRSEYAEHVVALVLDSPMLDFGKAVDTGASKEKIPGTGIPIPYSLTSLAKLIAELRFNIRWNELDYNKKVENLKIPVLLFHGILDSVVPVQTSDIFYEKNKDIVFRYIRKGGAEHVKIWNMNPAEYTGNIKEFLASISL